MPQFDSSTPIPMQVQSPSLDTALKPIASMLNIQGALQQQETNWLAQSKLSAQLQERQNLSKIDWNQFRDNDGNIDPVAAGNAALQASPAFYGPQLAKQFNEVAKDQITMKQGLQGLNQSQLEQIGSGLGSLAGKQDLGRNDVLNWASQFVEQHPRSSSLVMTALKYAPTSDNPADWQTWVTQQRNGILKPSEQGNDNNFVNTGGQTNVVSTNKYGISQPQVTGSLQNTVTPTQAEEVQTDALGNKYIVQRGPNGAILNTRPVPGSYNAAGGAAPGSGPANLPPGGVGAIDDIQKEVTSARAAANQAPVLHDLNRTIVDLVDKGVGTGDPARFFNYLSKSASGALGANLEFGSNTATNYNVLGKALERSALQASQGMGPHTNAGLDAQIRANGSLDYTPQAIRKIALLNDALTTGAEHYRNGLEAAIQAADGNVLAKRQFDQTWAQNFDVRAARLQNAAQAAIEKGINPKDSPDVREIIQEVGGINSKGYRDLQTRLQNLNTLTKQGHL